MLILGILIPSVRTLTLRNVQIKDGNFLGSRVSILPKAKIGTNNKIAAGSVIYIGTRNDSIYMGNPAKNIGQNS